MDIMDCGDATDQNIDAILPCDSNVVYNNVDTEALDDKTSRCSAGKIDTCDPGYELVELVVIDISLIEPLTHIANDGDVNPREPEDSNFNAAVEIKPIEIKPEICDVYSQDEAPTPACHDSYDNISQELTEIAESKEDSSEPFSAALKIKNESSKVAKVKDGSLMGFDVRVKIANSSDVRVKNKSSKQVLSKPTLKVKIKKGSREGKPFCDVCKLHFPTNIALMTHKKNHDKKRKHVCRICGLRFGDTPFLKNHMRIHFAESYFPCGVCGRSYTTAKKLENHAKRHKPNSKCPVCDICGETVTLGCLRDHKLKKHKDLRTCLKCGNCYSSKQMLPLHRCPKDTKDQKNHERLLTCSKCGKCYFSKQRLVSHRCYESRKTFACSVCSETFSSLQELKYHKTLHGGKTTDFCHLCGEGFTHWFYLDQHLLQVHPNEKCYPWASRWR